MINQTCDCKHVMNSIGRPPDFLLMLPNPPPPPPLQFLFDDLSPFSSLFENSNLRLVQNQPKCVSNLTSVSLVTNTNDSNEQSMYIFVTIVVFIALIILLVLFILFAFVYVYLNRLKQTDKQTHEKQKIDVSVNVLPFHQYGQQARSESSPSSTQSNLTSVLLNESDSTVTTRAKPIHFTQFNLRQHLIDSTTSSSYCSQTGLLASNTKRNDLFNSSSSSSSSSSGGFISSNLFNTRQHLIASDRPNNANILVYVPPQNESHQYESITDLSQYYFDINDELSSIKISPTNNVNTFQTTAKLSCKNNNSNNNNHLLNLSNSNLFRQQQLQQFQVKQQSFLNSLIV